MSLDELHTVKDEAGLKALLSADDADFCTEDQALRSKAWLEWVSEQRLLKAVASDVPEGILPSGMKAQLVDVKVFPKGQKGPPTDDAVYEQNQDIRDRVARGNSILSITHPDGKVENSCVVFALKKFTGGLGDEDDDEGGDEGGDEPKWKRFFSKPFEESKSFVSTAKANGEAAHLAIRRIGGKYIYFAGSKNVHVAFTSAENLQHYTESRYLVASSVAKTCLRFVESLEPERRSLLERFLSKTRFTATFEILQPDYQHVELLTNTEPELCFISWTSTNMLMDEDKQLCSMSPLQAFKLAEIVGFQPVKYQQFPISYLDTRMREIREGYGTEGDVLYFLDSEEQVIGLLKKKTVWYIIVRALREKVRTCENRIARFLKSNPSEEALEETVTEEYLASKRRFKGRLTALKEWLGLSDACVAGWTELSEGFHDWLRETWHEKHPLSHLFPVVWYKYLEVSGKSDKDPTLSQINE